MTPGRSPLSAMVLKHIRQMPNFLMNALGRPQIGHLEYARALNLCSRFAFTINDFFAKMSPFSGPERHSHQLKQGHAFLVSSGTSYNSDI
jgi:hypothetical protein